MPQQFAIGEIGKSRCITYFSTVPYITEAEHLGYKDVVLFSENDRAALIRLCNQKEILDTIYPQ